MERGSIIDSIEKMNGYDYNMRKAAEELNELSLIILQKLNKPGKVKDQDIIDEIGDVDIRLEILKKMFDRDDNQGKVSKRISYKLSKFASYIKDKKYTKI